MFARIDDLNYKYTPQELKRLVGLADHHWLRARSASSTGDAVDAAAPNSPSSDLLTRWRDGDEQAAVELVRCYFDRLIALTRSRLSPSLAQRFDAEDVVQSAYRSFFAGARAGRFDLPRGGDLWQLLVSITLHKLHRQVRHNQAGKRNVGRELAQDGKLPEAQAGAPSPIEVVALADELDQIMRGLDEGERDILQLRLQGYQMDEIAERTGRSERTVRRVLERLKRLMEDRHEPAG